jgi:hypothetical protein
VQGIEKKAKAHRKEASGKKRKFRRQWQRSTWIMDQKLSTNFDDHILYLDLCIKFIIWCTTLHYGELLLGNITYIIIYGLWDAMTVLVNILLYTELLEKKKKTADQPLAAPCKKITENNKTH